VSGTVMASRPAQPARPAPRAPHGEPSATPPPPMPRGPRWRSYRAALPLVVWLLAIAAALGLLRGVGPRGNLPGFADATSATLAHDASGVVRGVHVGPFDYVSRGQSLVTLDDSAARLRLAAVEKDIERLSAEVSAEAARLRATNAQAVAEVDDFARRTAIDREAAHIEYLGELMADARDRALLKGERVEHGIVRGLHENMEASFRELNESEADAESLRAKVERNADVIARKKQAFEEADRRWRRHAYGHDVGVSIEPVLAPLRLSMDVREQELLEIIRQIDAHVLRAPMSGQVTMLDAAVGDAVEPGRPLVVVTPTSTDRVVAYLPEHAAFLPVPGTPVWVRGASSEGPGEYAGRVLRLSTAITEAPPRHRAAPSRPSWGRGLIIALHDGARLMPGEAVAIRFGAVPATE
jgi:multidrug resistance efflux pump